MRYWEEIVPCEGDQALVQRALGSSGCPIPESVPEQVGGGLEQAGLVEGVHPHGRGVELDEL